MTSQKQIEANRANAQKSTGPNTTDGKSKSRLNAIRDNITGQITTLNDADRAVFEKLKAEHVASLAPETVSELKLAHAIAWDTWRLDRLRAAEMNIFAQAAENLDGDPNADEAEIDQELQSATSDANVYLTQAGSPRTHQPLRTAHDPQPPPQPSRTPRPPGRTSPQI